MVLFVFTSLREFTGREEHTRKKGGDTILKESGDCASRKRNHEIVSVGPA